MIKLSPRLTALVAATAAAGASGAAIAGAASSGSTGTTGSNPTQRHSGGPGAGETALTGETKQKVEAAVTARLPGSTILRTTNDRGGAYESHVRQSDGTVAEVKVSKEFTVTSLEAREADDRGRGGHGGPGGRGMHADGAAVAKALGVTQAKLQSAAEAARPDRSADKQDRGAERGAALATSLGESSSDVQAVLDSVRGTDGRNGPRGRGPGGPDDTALVAALVKKFSISESKAQAAVDAAQKAGQAERETRHTAMYAAIAKSLGKDADAVKAAFEANRPARPATP